MSKITIQVDEDDFGEFILFETEDVCMYIWQKGAENGEIKIPYVEFSGYKVIRLFDFIWRRE